MTLQPVGIRRKGRTPLDVFINCPFDAEYKPIFYAIVFTIVRAGYRARCALETDDAAENRLGKIIKIISECRYGIHDISRTETNGDPPLPRFNMPLELGSGLEHTTLVVTNRQVSAASSLIESPIVTHALSQI